LPMVKARMVALTSVLPISAERGFR
jgi:hypothetical protein